MHYIFSTSFILFSKLFGNIDEFLGYLQTSWPTFQIPDFFKTFQIFQIIRHPVCSQHNAVGSFMEQKLTISDFFQNTKCQHPILMLAGISCSDFENILDFIYRGEINVDSEKLPSLLQAAQILDIQALSPDALVVNVLPEPAPIFVNTNQVWP